MTEKRKMTQNVLFPKFYILQPIFFTMSGYHSFRAENPQKVAGGTLRRKGLRISSGGRDPLKYIIRKKKLKRVEFNDLYFSPYFTVFKVMFDSF